MDREVYFFHVIDESLPPDLLSEGSCLVVIADHDLDKLEWLAMNVGENDNTLWVCSVGALRQDVENAFDDISRFVVTTTHESLEEGVWFAVHVANHESRKIKQCIVLLIDKDEESKEKILKAIVAVAGGWEPLDEVNIIPHFLTNTYVNRLWFLTLLFFITPLIIYFFEKLFNILPSPDEWFSVNNHGPWRYSWEGLIIFIPQLILSIVVISTSSKKLPWYHKMGLVFAQMLAYLLHLILIAWTID